MVNVDVKALVARHLARSSWDTCPTCGGEKAEVDEQLGVVSFEAGRTVRCAVVTCGHCGHVRFFRASFLGLPGG